MALVLDRLERTLRRRRPLREATIRGPDGLMAPEAALDYFRSLIPRLGTDPERFGADQRRTAFTLARATDVELLARVQTAVREGIERGLGVREGGLSVETVLDAAGVSEENSGYAEMVFRSNAVESYNQGAWDQMQDPEIAETFPAWRYAAVVDGRSRPEHAAKDGLYWSASAPFGAVRGTQPADVINCRCTFIPTDRWDLDRLRAQGVEIRTEP